MRGLVTVDQVLRSFAEGVQVLVQVLDESLQPRGSPPLVGVPIPAISGWPSMLATYAARLPTFDSITLVDYPPINPTDVVTKQYVDSLTGTGTAASIVNVLDYGAKVDGVSDDAAAFNAAIAAALARSYGGKVVVPMGRMLLGSAIQVTVPSGKMLVIEGLGAAGTELYFSNATNGLSFTLTQTGGLWGSVALYGFSVVRGPTSPPSANTGLSIGVPSGPTCDGTVILRDLMVRGSTALTTRTNQWQTSIVIAGPNGSVIDSVTLYGIDGVATDRGDVLLSLTGGPGASQYATSFNVIDCTMIGGSAGVDVTGWVQGVFVANSTIIGQYDGVRWLDDGTHFAEELAIVNCSLNAGHRGVYTSHVNQNAVSNTTILRFNTGVAAGFAGVENNVSYLNSIIGNNVVGRHSGTENGYIISDAGNAANVVVGNLADNITGASIWLKGSTVGTTVVGNSAAGTGGVVRQDTGGNTIYGNTASGVASATFFYQPVVWSTATGVPRWFVGDDGATESGGNSGSNFEIVCAADAGNPLDAAFRIARNSGDVTVRSYIPNTHLIIDCIVGGTSTLSYEVNATPRWFVGTSGTESGSNSGSDFQLTSAADGGSVIGTPLSINRATGKTTLAGLNLAGLPTSATGLVAGDVWRNGNVLNIV